jgi:hypothetical protein
VSRAVEIKREEVNGITLVTMGCTVGEDEKTGEKGVPVEYQIPAKITDFDVMWKGATDEAKEQILESYVYGWALKARSAARPGGGGVQLPVVSTKKWGKLNLVTGEFDGGTEVWNGTPLELKKRIAMVQAVYGAANAKEEPVPAAVRKAHEELVSGGHMKAIKS